MGLVSERDPKALCSPYALRIPFALATNRSPRYTKAATSANGDGGSGRIASHRSRLGRNGRSWCERPDARSRSAVVIGGISSADRHAPEAARAGGDRLERVGSLTPSAQPAAGGRAAASTTDAGPAAASPPPPMKRSGRRPGQRRSDALGGDQLMEQRTTAGQAHQHGDPAMASQPCRATQSPHGNTCRRHHREGTHPQPDRPGRSPAETGQRQKIAVIWRSGSRRPADA